MNHLVILIIVLLSCLTSCGVQKQAMSQDVKAESFVMADDSVSLDRTIRRLVNEAINEDVRLSVIQEVEMDRQIYAPPDSLGNQYIVETQTLKMKTDAQGNRTLQADRIEDNTESVDSISVSASVEDLGLDMETDIETKDALPWWQKTLMIIGAAVLLYVVLRIILKLI